MNRHTVTIVTSPTLTSGNAVTIRVAVVTIDRHAALATVTPVQPCDLRKHGPGDGCDRCDGRVPFLSPRGCVGRWQAVLPATDSGRRYCHCLSGSWVAVEWQWQHGRHP
jgi:hypothetical protein